RDPQVPMFLFHFLPSGCPNRPLRLWQPHVLRKIDPLYGLDMERLLMSFCTADIGIFIGYAPTKKAFRIYNRRTRRIVETIHVDFDELKAMASEQSSLGPSLNDTTLGNISSGLVLDDDSTGSPFSTTVDQDAPSPSKSLTPTETQSSVSRQDVGNDNLDMEVTHMGNDPLLGVPFPEITSDQSSLTAVEN
nr:retrovirus-related Pol polyprotein from transposon TNT 1-94 [Tanacetum cinerariifolium]